MRVLLTNKGKIQKIAEIQEIKKIEILELSGGRVINIKGKEAEITLAFGSKECEKLNIEILKEI